jgi:hypothetical protein
MQVGAGAASPREALTSVGGELTAAYLAGDERGRDTALARQEKGR